MFLAKVCLLQNAAGGATFYRTANAKKDADRPVGT
jgi:hypothetical protein